MSASEDIAIYLESVEDRQFGLIGRDLFHDLMPDEPDACVAVIEYGGMRADMAMGSSVAVENPRVQISVRDVAAQVAAERAKEIYLKLEGLMDQTLNEVEYFLVRALQPPFMLRRDERNRPIYGFNCEIQKRQQ